MYTYEDLYGKEDLQQLAKDLQSSLYKTEDGFLKEINKEYWTITNKGIIKKVKFEDKFQLLHLLFKFKENAIIFYLKELKKNITQYEKELKRMKKLYEKYNLRESI